MRDFNLQHIFNNIIEDQPNNSRSEKLDTQAYMSLGISRSLKKRLFVKTDDVSKLITFLRNELSKKQLYLTDNFIETTMCNFLIEAYSLNPKERKVEELLNKFKQLKRKKANIFVKIFNLQTDTEKYDGGSFVLYHPEYFAKTYKNPFMYTDINDTTTANSDNIAHIGLVFKNVEILQEDKEALKSIIQNKIKTFINIMSVAIGNKNEAQNLTANFNHISMEYHVLNENMIETSSFFSCGESTFSKGWVNLKTNSFFSQHKMLFKLLHKRDKQLEKKLYKSILWLGKSLQTENIADSFLQVSIALECLLARQEKGYYINPSLTYSLSETLAFIIDDTKKGRTNNFKELKELYGLRSSIVHSGKSEVTIKEYYEFFHRVRNGIYKILDLMELQKLEKIDDVYEYIEGLKFT